MGRPLRPHEPGGVYHVISRGNDRQILFYAREDFEYFLNLLSKARSSTGCRTFAYCLMPNHFHLLLRTETISLSRMMHYLLGSYARRFNLKFSRCGHVFENRFKAFRCRDEHYFLALLRYIHLNPVRAGLVDSAEAWEWSGHRELAGLTEAKLVEVATPLGYFASDFASARSMYTAFLREKGAAPNKIAAEDEDSSTDKIFECQVDPIAKRKTIEDLMGVVSGETGIPVDEIRSKRKLLQLSAARQLFIIRSLRQGLSVGEVARFLNCTPSAVSKTLSRAENVNKSTPGT